MTAAWINFEPYRIEISHNKLWGMDLPFNEFAFGMKFLVPAAYGNRFASRIKQELGLANAQKGDATAKDGSRYEIKFSSTTKKELNIRQLRPHQDCDGYIFGRTDDDCNLQLFFLNKEQMNDEMVKCKAIPTHGSKIDNQNNKNTEPGFKLRGVNFTRWENKYLVTIEKLKERLTPKTNDLVNAMKNSSQ
jgi:hypothetical protein